jgi:hypothetical protein
MTRLPCLEIFEATPDVDSFISEIVLRNQAQSRGAGKNLKLAQTSFTL